MYNMSSKKEKEKASEEERRKKKKKKRRRRRRRRWWWGEFERRGWRRKWLLRDQPCVRLASGDINTSDAAGATILPFTAGEGDKRGRTKGNEGESVRGAGSPPLPPRPTAPFTGTAPPDEKQEQRGWMFISSRAPRQGSIETNR